MVPPHHISLLIASGRRAREWKLGLARQGLAVQQIPTSGSEAAKGDFWLVVHESDRFRAQRYVSDVLSGDLRLPRGAPVTGPLLWGATLIVLAVTALVLAVLMN